MSASDSNVATVTPPPVKDSKNKPKPGETRPKHQPPYAVVVLNDNDHTYQYVAVGLTKVCGHPIEKAWRLADTIHRTGRAVVWSGSLEVAELKRDQIRGLGPDFWAENPVTYPLGVILEPMPQ